MYTYEEAYGSWDQGPSSKLLHCSVEKSEAGQIYRYELIDDCYRVDMSNPTLYDYMQMPEILRMCRNEHDRHPSQRRARQLAAKRELSNASLYSEKRIKLKN